MEIYNLYLVDCVLLQIATDILTYFINSIGFHLPSIFSPNPRPVREMCRRGFPFSSLQGVLIYMIFSAYNYY